MCIGVALRSVKYHELDQEFKTGMGTQAVIHTTSLA